MYDGDAFEQVVEDLVFDLNSLDADSVEPIVEEHEEGDEDEESSRRVLIHVSETEGPDYYIEGFEGERFFYIKCFYSLIIDLAATLSVNRIHEKREESSFEYDEEELLRYLPTGATVVDERSDATWHEDTHSDSKEAETDEANNKVDDDSESEGLNVWRDRIAAALDIVNGVSDEDEQEIIFNLVDVFSNVPTKFRVNSTQDGGLSGLLVRERIFPYEDDFSIKSLDDSIVRTRIPANMGMLFFQYVYDINIRQDEEGTISETPPDRPKISR